MSIGTIGLGQLVSWRTLLVLVVCYSVMPYLVLWIVVRCWPRDHPRRAEYLAEYDAVHLFMRPFWVADAAIRSLTDGLACRISLLRQNYRLTRADRRAVGLLLPGAVAALGAVVLAAAGSALPSAFLYLIAVVVAAIAVVVASFALGFAVFAVWAAIEALARPGEWLAARRRRRRRRMTRGDLRRLDRLVAHRRAERSTRPPARMRPR
jgi:hypothetical protein